MTPPDEPGAAPRLVVAVLGNSAGLDTLQALLRQLPAEPRMALVVMRHLDAAQLAALAHGLAPGSRLHCDQIVDSEPLRANRLYTPPPDRQAGLEADRLRLREAGGGAVDEFLQALAEHQRGRAAVLVLGGSGGEGMVGLRAVKARDGLVLAQSLAQAERHGLPRAALDSDAVDIALPVEEMPAVLERYATAQGIDTPPPADAAAEAAWQRILQLLQAHHGVDFQLYKHATLRRRVERRMHLWRLASLADYAERLREDANEPEQLGQDLMIGVTRFFRDPAVFEALRRQVLGELLSRTGGDTPLRIWVPGCASGEEAYSLAMLLLEQMDQQGRSLPVKVFASDIHHGALDRARRGQYPSAGLTELSEARRQRFFRDLGNGHHEVGEALRELMIFARQNVITDPPFYQMDLISCRNLMIYLRSAVQDKLIRLFHFALRPGGYLLLGNSETVGDQQRLFRVLNRQARLYQRLDSAPAAPTSLLLSGARNDTPRPEPGGREQHRQRTRLLEQAQRWLLDEYAPATILVSPELESLYFHGDVERFLSLPQGRPTLNLLELLPAGLLPQVREALQRSLAQRRPVELSQLSLPRGMGKLPVRLRITPLRNDDGGDGLLIVSFLQSPLSVTTPAAPAPLDAPLMHDLERELKSTRADLRGRVAEMESANQELQLAHQEAMSANEELQSVNEELETSREELQSLNSELSAVNQQYQGRIQRLEQTADELLALLASTELAILFLDRELRIRRYTPACARVLPLLPGDIQRPLGELNLGFLAPDLLSDATRVLADLESVARELAGPQGRCFQRRILPYRSQDDRIDGVVVVLHEVTDRHHRDRHERQLLGRLTALVDRLPLGLGDFDDELHPLRLNPVLAGLLEQQCPEPSRPPLAQPWSTPLARQLAPLLRRVLAGEDGLEARIQRCESPTEAGLLRDWQVHGYRLAAPPGGVGVMVQDITWSQYAQRCLAVEQAVARVLGDGREVDDTLAELLAEMTRLTEIAIGEYWEPDGAGEQLHCRCFHPRRLPGAVGDLKRYFDDVPLSTEDSLLGAVWRRREPVWLGDVKTDRRFSRLVEATELGLRTALALPVLAGERPLGVIALYTRERLPRMAPFPGMLLRVGRDVGQFLQRHAAEQAARAREARLGRRGDELALMLDSAPLALCLLDRRQRLLRANAAFTALLDDPRAPYLGESCERVCPALGGALRPLLPALLEDAGTPGPTLLTLRQRDGTPRRWRLTLHPQRGADHQVLALACALQALDEDGQPLAQS